MAATGVVEQRWSDLPSDLLSVVYLKIASAYDRARFAAVCSPWCAAVAWHPRLPALPLLLLSTGNGKRDREAWAFSPEDGRAVRVPLPWFPWGNRLVGSYNGGWIATMSGSDELLVVNLFSGVRALCTANRFSIWKIVFSKDPSSGDCIIAAMRSTLCEIALRRVGSPDNGWTMQGYLGVRYGDLKDIAFFNNELFGVTSDELIMFDTGINKEGGILVATRVFRIDVTMRSLYTVEISSSVRYIFQLNGKLAVAVEVKPRDSSKKCQFFRVFQIAKNNNPTSSCRYTWAEVTSLGDHALFLGPAGCCKAVHVSTASRRGGVEGNRIYYYKQHAYLHDKMKCLARLDVGSCTVHCSENEDKHYMEKIVSRGYHYIKDEVGANGCNGCLWLWPPDF